MVDPSLICMRCMSALPRTGVGCTACGAHAEELENETNQLPVGSILAGKYLAGCVIGQGGFGITYIGWDLNLGIKLAIKEYYPEGLVGRDSKTQSSVIPLKGEKGTYFLRGRDKFVEEARTLAKFSGDPGIVSVHDFFNENGTAYIVMDFVEGKTLKQIAEERNGKLTFKETLRYLLPVMDSLGNVHQAGLLHRDISPDNIIVTPEGRAVLLDFGAARRISAMGEHSNTINVKHGYAPEEQYRTRGEQGPWTDVYALCATIYRLTTGRTPTPAPDRVMSDSPLPPPNALGADLTLAQQAAIMKGLAIRGQNRQQSMRELKDQLTPAVKEPAAATTNSATRNSQNQPSHAQLSMSLERSKTRIAWVPLVIIVLLMMGTLFLLWIKKNPDLIVGSNDTSMTKAEETSVQESDAIVWDDPFLEAGIRKALGKSNGETISEADTALITALAVLGDSVIINDAEIASELQFTYLGVYLPDSQTPVVVPERIISMKDLAYFPNLKTLTLIVSGVDGIEGLKSCTSMEELTLYCIGLEDAAPLASMHDLQKLYIRGAELDENDLQTLGQLSNIEYLSLPYCKKATSIEPLGSLSKLKTLDLSGSEVTDIQALSNLNTLTELDMSNTKISSIQALSNSTSLTILDLGGMFELSDFSALSGLTNLEKLDLDSTSIIDLIPLEKMTKLEHLNLGSTSVEDLSPLKNLVNLKSLYLDYSSVSDLSPLQDMTEMETLMLYDTYISDLSALRGMRNLRTLEVSETEVHDLSPLRNLTNLRELLVECDGISDLAPLKNLTNLEELVLSSANVSDITPLTDLVNLEELHLSYTHVSNLSPLKNLLKLVGLTIMDTDITDVSPLKGLPLQYIYADDDLKQELQEMFPNADIG